MRPGVELEVNRVFIGLLFIERGRLMSFLNHMKWYINNYDLDRELKGDEEPEYYAPMGYIDMKVKNYKNLLETYQEKVDRIN